jgi:CO/xanthine dehydrogenase Mo-binding subunit
MTDGRKRAFGVEGADVGLGLRPKNIGARIKRVEDPRLLTGQGSFTADRIVPGALHVAFRRSDHAHALIASICTSAAAEVPGVFAIYTAQDLHDLVEPVRASSRMKVSWRGVPSAGSFRARRREAWARKSISLR